VGLRGSPVERRSSSDRQIRRWDRLRVLALAAVAVAVAVPAAALAGPSAPTPAKDSFTGRVTAATGIFARDHGAVTIALAPRPGNALRRLTLTLRGAPCSGKGQCVQLSGKLTGTLAPGPMRVPDAGRSFTIAATGTIKPLGHVSATGTVHGTGFIANGHENLRLLLMRAGGTVTIEATSPPVPGFTSP